MALTGTGPALGIPNAVDQVRLMYQSMNLERMIPWFVELDDSTRVLPTVDQMPSPDDADASLPEIIDIIMETPGLEPEIAFPDFIRGVAVASLTVNHNRHDNVKEAVMAVAERIMNGGDLPPLRAEYIPVIRSLEEATFNNQESVSWRPLLAFMQGAYYLLGYVKDPDKRRGKMSASEFVEQRLRTSIALGYTPK